MPEFDACIQYILGSVYLYFTLFLAIQLHVGNKLWVSHAFKCNTTHHKYR